MSVQTIATLAGIIIQLVGALCLVVQANYTSRRLSNFQEGLTYNNFNETLNRLAQEVANQFKQQLTGFGFLLVGSGFQFYGAI